MDEDYVTLCEHNDRKTRQTVIVSNFGPGMKIQLWNIRGKALADFQGNYKPKVNQVGVTMPVWILCQSYQFSKLSTKIVDT